MFHILINVALLFHFKCKDLVHNYMSWYFPYNKVLLWDHATYFQAHHGTIFLHIHKHSSTIYLSMKITLYFPLYHKAGLFNLLGGHNPINTVKN